MLDPNASWPASDEAARADPSLPGGNSGTRLNDAHMAAMLGLGSSGTVHEISHDWQPPTLEELRKALPQYDVQKFLARGGMGAVYLGYQKALDRNVAIKVLPPVFSKDELYKERFKQEAKALAKLSHPGIVGVYDAGETAEGLLYMVMEFVDGTDLARLVESECRIDPDQTLAIVSAICEALAFAHESGILHRDIKPSNILLDSRGRVKIVDFGLARSLEQGLATFTRSDLVVGTTDFIAPEMMIPGAKADARADLYAVGVMLYQMLTGQIPRGRFAVPSSQMPGLDPGIDQLIDRALQAAPENRHSNALEMRTELERIRHKTGSSQVAQRTAPGIDAPSARIWVVRGVAGFLALSLAALFIHKLTARSNHVTARSNQGEQLASLPLPQQKNPTANASYRTPKFPTGVWIPIKTEMLGTLIGSITITSDGAWKLTHSHSLTLPGFFAKDVAVRAHVKRPEEVEHAGLQVRVHGTSRRSIDFGRNVTLIQSTFGEGKGAGDHFPHDPDLGVERPVLLELAALGELTFASIDGIVLPPLWSKEPASRGTILLWSQNAEFSEVEVMILDGVDKDHWPMFVRDGVDMDNQKRLSK